jgi:signal transduction histidine kinase
VTTLKPTNPYCSTDYCGRILNDNYSDNLKEILQHHINACREFDEIGLAIMPYIAAWNVDKPGIWYEFASQRLLNLFGITPEQLSKEFSKAILDRREYEQADTYPDVREMILKQQEIDDQRRHIREESIESGRTEAVYKVQLPGNRVRWLKDWASVTTFLRDGICLSPGYLADVSMEMDQKDQVSELNILVNRDKELLVEAERHAALGQISAKVYHEIRNPILSIGGLAKRLSEQLPADGQRPYMAVIMKEAERLENILNNLFKFTGPLELNCEPVQPVELVKRVIGLLRSELDRYGIKVSFISQKQLPDLMLDQEQIHEALVHIVKNSIDAINEGGSLDVELGLEEEYLSIIIRDSGTGISATHESRATEPFFTTKVYGSGLGLSLAQKAVQLHGGELEIRRLDTGGTEVIILLPLDSRELE